MIIAQEEEIRCLDRAFGSRISIDIHALVRDFIPYTRVPGSGEERRGETRRGEVRVFGSRTYCERQISSCLRCF